MSRGTMAWLCGRITQALGFTPDCGIDPELHPEIRTTATIPTARRASTPISRSVFLAAELLNQNRVGQAASETAAIAG